MSVRMSHHDLQKAFFDEYRSKYKLSKGEIAFTKSGLEKELENPTGNFQEAVFREFIEFYKLSNEMRDFTSSIKWTTSNIKNTIGAYRQQQLWENAKLQNTSVKIDPSFFEKSRNAEIQQLYKQFETSLSKFSKFQNKDFNEAVNKIYENYIDDFFNDRELEKLGDNIKRSLINYSIQTKVNPDPFLSTLNQYENSPSDKLSNIPRTALIHNYFSLSFFSISKKRYCF